MQNDLCNKLVNIIKCNHSSRQGELHNLQYSSIQVEKQRRRIHIRVEAITSHF